MKKFLSLVLALVMTMSLVTISAGAAEYNDLTDKGEIQYEEAVAVLNRLGIITGYTDGSFQPKTELTRGAAAKIIVSLLIGTEAANNLVAASAPYTDVPVDHTFAGVISYCKTAKIINGYADGSFKPAGTLSGYAFSKMLLGALGYKGDLEGFSGAGWTMNVARLGNAAGLFDRLSFKGNESVNREQACQLALNTLKATLVEYTGGLTVTAGDASVVGGQTRTYVTSNQEFATHINNKKSGDTGNAVDVHYTVEFGEEHFVDLRMKRERSVVDNFGRPSNEWSYKKVTIGTYPVDPDFVYTAQTAHLDATDAAKNRATGLSGYVLERTATRDDSQTDTRVWINGKVNVFGGNVTGTSTNQFNGGDMTIEDISDLTDNGTVVEVYVSEDTADFITDVVVIQSQLMEVRRIGSDYVALQKEDNKDVDSMVAGANAFNQYDNVLDASVENVQTEDAGYALLSGLKVGDIVVVVPVVTEHDGNRYEVGDVYVPETVKGALTAVDTYGVSGQTKKSAVAVTVGGNSYKVALWARDLYKVDPEAVKVTRKEVTLTLDRNGNAMKAEDVGETNDWFIVGRYYSTMVDSRIVTIAEGWDASGNELTLNLGTQFRADSTPHKPGDLVRYKNSNKNSAEWELTAGNRVYDVDSTRDIRTSDVQIKLDNVDDYVYADKGIKFVYVTFESDNSGEVASIQVKSGVQEVKSNELSNKFGKGNNAYAAWDAAQAGVNLDDDDNPEVVKVVVVKGESNDAMSSNLLYIRTQIGGGAKDEQHSGKMIYHYTAAMMTADGLIEETHVYSHEDLDANTFAAYSEETHEGQSNFYHLRAHNNFTTRTTSTFQVSLSALINEVNTLIAVNEYAPVLGTQADVGTNLAALAAEADGNPTIISDPRNGNGGRSNEIRVKNAAFVDLRDNNDKYGVGKREINTSDDLVWVIKNCLDTKNVSDGKGGYVGNNQMNAGDKTLEMQIVVNDNGDNNSFRNVALVIITSQKNVTTPYQPPASTKTTLTAVLDKTGLNKTLSASVPNVLTTTELGTTKNKTIEFTPAEGATVDIVAGPGTTTTGTLVGNVYTLGADIADGNKLTVEVTAEDTVTKATYTYTFEEKTGRFVSQKVDATLDTNSVLANAGAQTLSLTGNDLKLNVLDDGTPQTIYDQIKEAYEFLECTFVDAADNGNGTWNVVLSRTGMSGTPMNVNGTATITKSLAKIKVGNTDAYYTPSTKQNAVTGLNFNIKEVEVDGTTTSYFDGNAAAVNGIKAGATYTDKAYAMLAGLPTCTDFSVAVTNDNGNVTASSRLTIGSTYTVTLTATAKKTNGTGPFNNKANADLVFTGATSVAVDESNTAGVVKGTPTTTTITFVDTGSTDVVKVGDKFSGTFTVVAPAAATTTAPTITFTPAS